MVQRPPRLILNTRKEMEEEEEEEEEELVEKEEESLLSGCKVVEYLGPVMSSELLFKFPDNSAFDFDYSQSSIWSPLVPRFHRPPDVDMALVTPTKLTFALGFQELDKKKKTSAFNLNLSALKKKKQWRRRRRIGRPSEISPSPVPHGGGCAPFGTKGWNKLLKAASKHFKKRKRRDSTCHVKLSNYLR